MPTEKRQQGCHGEPLSAKAAYAKAAHDQLAETRRKLAGVNAKILDAINSGKIKPNGQLERARRAIDDCFTIAEVRLDRLRNAGEDEWKTVSVEVESAWEDLSRSIRRLVSTISD